MASHYSQDEVKVSNIIYKGLHVWAHVWLFNSILPTRIQFYWLSLFNLATNFLSQDFSICPLLFIEYSSSERFLHIPLTNYI